MKFVNIPGQNLSETGHEVAGRKTGNLPSFSSHQCITTFDRCGSLDQRGRDGKGKDCLTSRNSLSSWGGYRGGCGPGARDGEDLLRRTPNLPRRRVLLLRDVETGGARDNTKAMDGSVGSGERIFTFFFLFRGIYKTAGGRTQKGAVRVGKGDGRCGRPRRCSFLVVAPYMYYGRPSYSSRFMMLLRRFG